MIRRPPRSPLFPSPPLFGSGQGVGTVPRQPRGLGLELGLGEIPEDRLHDVLRGPAAPRGALELDDAVLLRRDLPRLAVGRLGREEVDRKSTRLNSSHLVISYAVFCLKKKKKKNYIILVLVTID